jgi:hypothetical protein
VGVLTDFVIADVRKAKAIGDCPNPSSKFGGLDAKGVSTVTLSALELILGNAEFSENTETEELLYQRSEEGPWVVKVSDKLVVQMALVKEEQVAGIVRKCLENEDFVGWQEPYISNFLTSFANLCRRAITEKKSVLMWMSL